MMMMMMIIMMMMMMMNLLIQQLSLLHVGNSVRIGDYSIQFPIGAWVIFGVNLAKIDDI